MLFLVGFVPSRGASRLFGFAGEPPIEEDSLPIRPSVRLTTDAQKRINIYGDNSGGDSLLRLSFATDSTYAPAYYALAQLYSRQQGMPVDSVVRYARKAYQIDSLNKWYSDLYAQSLAISGDYTPSLALYRRAIERDPQNPNAYIMAAMLYSRTSQPHEALSLLDSAEVRTGKNSYISSMKRELLLSTGQRERAIAEAIEMTTLEPQEVEHKIVLADLYISTQQDSLARIALEAAIETDSTSLLAINALAQFHIERGNMLPYFSTIKLLMSNESESLELKVSMFGRLTAEKSFYAKNFFSINEIATLLYRLYPTEKSVVELYATHLIASGELNQALELYKSHLDDQPVEYDYYTSVIDIESYLRNIDSVELYATRAIEHFPTRHELRLSQANLYSYTGRYTEANALYTNALKILPSDSLRGAVWGSIGDNYHQLSLLEKPGSAKAKRQMRNAYKAYDNSLELYAANAMVLNNYAYFLSLEQRDLGRALDMSGRAIALVEGNSTYLDTYAWILFELGRYDEAKKIMRQVIALDTTESAEIQFHYAEILRALSETFMAEIYYDKALRLGYDAQIIEERKALLTQ